MTAATIVAVPHGRVRAVLSLSVLGDLDFQWRSWSRREQPDMIWGNLYGHLAELYDGLDLLPEPVDEPGQVLATDGEVYRIKHLTAVLDPTAEADYVDFDEPDSFLLDPRWPRIALRSRAVVNLLVLNGGFLDSHVDWDRPTLVDRPYLRGTAMQCLASIADQVYEPADHQGARHYRDYDTARTWLFDHGRLADVRTAVGDIYRNGDELVRLERLHESIEAGHDRAGIADLAAACMSAMVRAGGGWHYEDPAETSPQAIT